MSKAILLSIQPKWLAKILNDEKTVEIRKTMPKCELPIDVYLYAVKSKKDTIGHVTSYRFRSSIAFDVGKVVAKFTLRKVEKINGMSEPSFNKEVI